MKGKTTALLSLALALAGILGSTSANARGGHSHASVGFVIGGPAYWPSYYYGPPAYPYPYYHPYYYPPVIAVPYSPPVYIERAQEDVSNEQYWYFCSDPQGYYPYIKNCKTNWQRVTPAPGRN